MKPVTIKFSMIILLLLFVPFLDSCTSERSREPSRDGASISALMASMNIQPIPSPSEAPDFELFSVKGERVSFKQYRGKVVLLSFWTTW